MAKRKRASTAKTRRCVLQFTDAQGGPPKARVCEPVSHGGPHETPAIFLLLIASNQNLPQQVAVNLVDHDVKADGPDHDFVRTRPVCWKSPAALRTGAG